MRKIQSKLYTKGRKTRTWDLHRDFAFASSQTPLYHTPKLMSILKKKLSNIGTLKGNRYRCPYKFSNMTRPWWYHWDIKDKAQNSYKKLSSFLHFHTIRQTWNEFHTTFSLDPGTSFASASSFISRGSIQSSWRAVCEVLLVLYIDTILITVKKERENSVIGHRSSIAQEFKNVKIWKRER